MEYMASGLPFSSGVAVADGVASRVDFPFVTSELYIKNRGGADLAFGWTANGVLGTNNHILLINEAITLRIRVKSIFFAGVGGSADVDLTAALTTIPARAYPTLTGSNADPVSGGPLYLTGSIDRSYGYFGVG
jgi:hypothetical protein